MNRSLSLGFLYHRRIHYAIQDAYTLGRVHLRPIGESVGHDTENEGIQLNRRRN